MTFLLAPREAIGRAIGTLWAPAIAGIATLRQARMFHPQGIVCRGVVEPTAGSPLGERLAGPVMARFSAALWKGDPRWFDVLGVALRFGDDQDLLFATIRSPLTLNLAPLFTDTDDFVRNRYWAVSPFAVQGVGRLKFRLSPATPDLPALAAGHRDARLERAVSTGLATWNLETRAVFHRHYQLIARVHLDRLAPEVDQEALRFRPDRAGRGIVPSGLIHAIRPSAYGSSQAARPSHE